MPATGWIWAKCRPMRWRVCNDEAAIPISSGCHIGVLVGRLLVSSRLSPAGNSGFRRSREWDRNTGIAFVSIRAPAWGATPGQLTRHRGAVNRRAGADRRVGRPRSDRRRAALRGFLHDFKDLALARTDPVPPARSRFAPRRGDAAGLLTRSAFRQGRRPVWRRHARPCAASSTRDDSSADCRSPDR